MRHRPVKAPEAFIASAVASLIEGEAQSLPEFLLEQGLPPENLKAVEARFVAGAMQLCQNHQERWLRALLEVLGRSPAGMALRRAIVGAGGRTLAQDAESVGCDRSNLYRAEQRIRKRLAKIGQQAA